MTALSVEECRSVMAGGCVRMGLPGESGLFMMDEAEVSAVLVVAVIGR